MTRPGTPCIVFGALILCSAWASAPALGQGSFTAFESGQVRPLALSADGERLFATNTPDNRLEIYAMEGLGLRHLHSVPVGMEPVAVATLEALDQVWVVNHLSDSVSVVSLSEEPPRVVRTLRVGDEPRDIVFAGPEGDRAFISTAHRGQHSPIPYRPFESEGRADVWVFDANDEGEVPLTIVTLFGDTPRPLAVSPDGGRVYAGVLHSGNRTTIVTHERVGDEGQLPPLANVEGLPAPEVGLIVSQVGDQWLDAGGRDWSDMVRVSLPDYDVFAIDANAETPVEVARYSGVGTTLFNMAVNPAKARLYVTNLEARNQVRFEGPGELSGGETVRGHFIENRLTVIDLDDGTVQPRHLNQHIDYDRFPGTESENSRSLATPLEMAISADGATLWLAAMGSDKVASFDTDALETGTFVPDETDHIAVPGGGPTGLVLDEARQRLYVLSRFNNAVVTIDIERRRAIQSAAMFNPEPTEVRNGRRFLYDARLSSSRGDSSCAGCHIFGDLDQLSWDLGNPDGLTEANPNPPVPTGDQVLPFHPMKGPLSTQSLRGMSNHGPLHWRGDRTGGNDPDSGDPFDVAAAFRAFNGAFEGLLGATAPLSDGQMEAFTDFALALTYPPNPIRALDNSLTTEQQLGEDIFRNRIGGQGVPCNDCHTVDKAQGLFGSSGLTGGARAGQPMKVAHFRNLYTKVGFIGRIFSVPQPPVGDQIRGYGYIFDGSFDTLPNFLRSFSQFETSLEREATANFLLAVDSNLAPIVGQQITLRADNFAAAIGDWSLLRERAGLGECDLIGHGIIDGEARGMTMLTAPPRFQLDRAGEELSLRDTLLAARAPGNVVTFTCVPPGAGVRMGIDRDEDGILDGDEAEALR
ncbi:MAG: hypothetical protein AAF184_23100 [Pseudomonadota bacterium]